MLLFGSTLSPYVRKAWAFGVEKGLTLEPRPGGMGRGGPAFEAASPFGKIPALQDEDFAIADSSAIVTYLEAKFPDPALIPAEARARARTIWYDELADTLIMAAGSAIFGNRFVLPRVLNRPCDHEAVRAAHRDLLPPILDYLEAAIPDSGYLVQDRITLADIAVASPFATLRCIGVQVDAATYPRTAAYLDAIHARPSFAEVLARDCAMVAAMGGAVAAE
ncbi:glutathione S-transferase family protein [Sphingomonas hengshuiensis]|uniref:Glutathione S-transferase n=1 Tax=Sphingomonas hengshuiensis TaxID=1609977 RepID=A0A7U4JAI7_9SPHN|nr:glutathione S-transferase family protein [Sphingomonas hengshuiensis]AJP73177.1 glutathione S-transferase [Sphingomonas hengshuiensis]